MRSSSLPQESSEQFSSLMRCLAPATADEYRRECRPAGAAATPAGVGDEGVARLIAVVDLDRHDLVEPAEDLLQARLERRKKRQVERRDREAFGPGPGYGLPAGPPPAS